MTNHDLAKDYILRAGYRLQAVEVLLSAGAYPDVIRECQEALELPLKGYLRSLKLDPPKWHDVSSLFEENKNLLHPDIYENLKKICDLSRFLRKERENSFYGDDDLIPLSSYTQEQAAATLHDVRIVHNLIKKYV